MLLYNLLKSLVLALNTVFGQLSYVLGTGEHLPTYFGIDTDYYVNQGIMGFKLFAGVFPVLGIIMQAALAYIGFRLVLLLVKVVLGSRLPMHNS